MPHPANGGFMQAFDVDKYFGKASNDGEEAQQLAGKAGIWLLHLVKGLLVLFSGYHIFSASMVYAEGSVASIITNFIGLLAVELTLIGLYLAGYNRRINGQVQRFAAIITYTICFLLAALGVITDGWLNRGNALTPFLRFYFDWLLLLSPFIAIAGGLVVHFTSPDKLRQMKESLAQDELEREMFEARIAEKRAALAEAKAVKTMQLQAREAVLQQLHAVYTGDEVRRAITQTAVTHAPTLLRQAGIDLDMLAPQLPAPDDEETPASEETPAPLAETEAETAETPASPPLVPSPNGKVSPNGVGG